MRFVFASNNAHKLAEVRAIMPAGIEVLSLRDIGFEAEIAETGSTLAENSAIKARTVWEWMKTPSFPLEGDEKIDGVFADDTGLEIDALDGEPGVYTARWYRTPSVPLKGDERKMKGDERKMSEEEIYAANRAKALRELEGKTDRGAQFKTVITLLRGDEIRQVEGIVRGRIATEEYGESGFGYDPLFIPEGYDKTFGELPAEVKNGISHRARALAELVKIIDE